MYRVGEGRLSSSDDQVVSWSQLTLELFAYRRILHCYLHCVICIVLHGVLTSFRPSTYPAPLPCRFSSLSYETHGALLYETGTPADVMYINLSYEIFSSQLRAVSSLLVLLTLDLRFLMMYWQMHCQFTEEVFATT